MRAREKAIIHIPPLMSLMGYLPRDLATKKMAKPVMKAIIEYPVYGQVVQYIIKLDIMKANGAISDAAGTLNVLFSSGAFFLRIIIEVGPASCVKIDDVVPIVAS